MTDVFDRRSIFKLRNRFFHRQLFNCIIKQSIFLRFFQRQRFFLCLGAKLVTEFIKFLAPAHQIADPVGKRIFAIGFTAFHIRLNIIFNRSIFLTLQGFGTRQQSFFFAADTFFGSIFGSVADFIHQTHQHRVPVRSVKQYQPSQQQSRAEKRTADRPQKKPHRSGGNVAVIRSDQHLTDHTAGKRKLRHFDPADTDFLTMLSKSRRIISKKQRRTNKCQQHSGQKKPGS